MGKSRNAKISPIDKQRLEQSGGQPLPPAMKLSLENEFRTSLDDIRAHTGRNAQQITQKVGAKAYSVDNHIVFAPGVFQPNSTQGRDLVKHELAHVVQQRQGKH